ncbi:MAG TPA: RNA 2',3'-cyclic phosphodiesterase [Chthonomonadales bacterium]|nr:RNA 2',3'-cyclic phosphodiesterase [Chthonomonadales bacterium]
MRLFFAIELPPELVEAAARAQAHIRAAVGDDGVRWVRPEQMHLTLKFLGEVPVQRAHRAVDAAHSVRIGHNVFELALGAVGAFPSASRPSTLWLGISTGHDAVVALAGDLNEALARERFPADRRALTPHLTMARVRSYAGEAAAGRAMGSAVVAPTRSAAVGRFVLMKSTLGRSGSAYDVVDAFPLRGGDDMG